MVPSCPVLITVLFLNVCGGGVLSYNCLGQAGAKSPLWGLVLGPGLCVGAGVADDYM